MARPSKCNSGNATHTLLLLKEGKSATQVSAALGENKSSTIRRIRRLERQGFITQTYRSSTIVWMLTPAGKTLLKDVLRVPDNATSKSLFRRHYLVLKMALIRGRRGFSDKVLVESGFVGRNRGAISGFELGLKEANVFFTGSSFLVFPKPYEAVDLLDFFNKGFFIGDRVRAELEHRFPWVELDGRSEVCREHIAKRGGISKWVPDGFKFQGDRVLVDFSTGQPEIETWGKFSMEGMLRICGFLDRVANGEFEPLAPGPRIEVG